MTEKVAIRQLPTSVPGLDQILGGGLPEFSFNLIVGSPGSGKTTLLMVLAGFTRPEVIVFLGSLFVIDALIMIFFSQNFWMFPRLIAKGDLDFYLIKPVSAVFMSFTRFPNVASWLNLAVGVSVRVGVLLGVTLGVADGVAADDAKRIRVERLEPPVHRSVEHQVTRCRQRAAPHRERLADFPHRPARNRIPRRHLAAMPARTRIHLDVRSDVRRPGNVICLRSLHVHAQILMRDVEQSGLR